MKTWLAVAAVGALIPIVPETPWEIARNCEAEANRLWSEEAIAWQPRPGSDYDPPPLDAQAAQWWMMGCRAGVGIGSGRKRAGAQS